MRRRRESGQAMFEYIIILLGVMMPLVFALIFTAELLWVWHGMVEFTREGARYAATHCWQSSPDNVTGYMLQHIPPMVDQAQLASGESATLSVQYFARDPDTGLLGDFSCDSDCSTGCIPDVVTVSVQNYQFRRFVTFLGLPPSRSPTSRPRCPSKARGAIRSREYATREVSS